METSLSAKEICSIIKASKDAGVRSINIHGLTIEFYPHRNEASESHRNVNTGNTEETVGAEVATRIPSGWEEQAKLFDEQAVSDAEEAALMVDSPLVYEKEVVFRDMERNRVMGNG